MKLGRKNTIDAGDLREVVTLLQPSRVDDGRGGSTTTYTSVGEVWAKVRPVRHSRSLVDAQVQFREAFEFIIRVSTLAITPDWRLTYNGEQWTIHGIDDIDTRREYFSIIAYTQAI